MLDLDCAQDEHCVSGASPWWQPPAQCHDMFSPLQEGLRVNLSKTSSSKGKGHGGWGKTSLRIVEGQTIGSCCNECYLDFQSDTPCQAWTMPEPANGSCFLYGGYSLQIWVDRNAPTGDNATFKGAHKFNPPRPPGPPPPAPCASKQPTVVWPEWGASVAEDKGVRFDLCNVSVQDEIKRTRCDFWHQTVDQYWELDKWIPADPSNKHRGRIRELFSQHVAARRHGMMGEGGRVVGG